MATAQMPPRGVFPSEQNKTEHVKKEKVTKGETKMRKSDLTLSEKFADAFFTKDVASVKRHVLSEVVIPGIKSMFLDAVCDGLSMFLDVDRRPSGSKKYTYSSGGTGYSYDKIYTGNKSAPVNERQDDLDDGGARASYRDIVYLTKNDANEVLSSLQNLAHPDQYGEVSVADLFDLADVSINDQKWTDNKYGWTWDMIKHVPIRKIREGYILDLPRPKVLG